MLFDTGKSELIIFETSECLSSQGKGRVSKDFGNVEFENHVAQVMDFELKNQAIGYLSAAS